jgi:hypothetical protein
VPKKLVSLCKLIVSDSRCCVKVEGHENLISFLVCVKEMLCHRYCLVVCLSMYFGRVKCHKITSYSISLTRAYADDLCILGRNVAAVRELLVQLEPVAQLIGIVINETKIQHMTTACSGVRRDLVFGESNFEGVTSFKYFGSLVTADNNVTMDIKTRLVGANKPFFSVRSLLKSKDNVAGQQRSSCTNVLFGQ